MTHSHTNIVVFVVVKDITVMYIMSACMMTTYVYPTQ